MAEKEYHRLTFARAHTSFGAAFAGQSSLWLGKDHLLGIESTNFVETYKRFYFRDIQAITVVQSKRRMIWNWVLGSLTVLCAAAWGYGLLTSPFDPGLVILAIIVTSPLAVPLLINNLLGPTCKGHIRTAVQTEELVSLKRVRKVRKILDRIRPLIVAAQGQLVPEEIPARMRALSDSLPVPGAAPFQPSGTSIPGAAGQPTRYVIDDLNAPPRILP